MHVGPLQKGLCAQTEGLLYTALHGVDLTHRDNLNEAGVVLHKVLLCLRGVLYFPNLRHFYTSL